jgi:hypothetical protein
MDSPGQVEGLVWRATQQNILTTRKWIELLCTKEVAADNNLEVNDVANFIENIY